MRSLHVHIHAIMLTFKLTWCLLSFLLLHIQINTSVITMTNIDTEIPSAIIAIAQGGRTAGWEGDGREEPTASAIRKSLEASRRERERGRKREEGRELSYVKGYRERQNS